MDREGAPGESRGVADGSGRPESGQHLQDERTRELLTLDAIAHALVALGMKET
jgi:hypothetical protein